MRIGYPCINRSLASRCGGGFRLASFTPARFRATVTANLAGLAEMVAYNRQHGLLFLRISSDLVPFASHPVCTLDWAREFAAEFARIGRSIRDGGLRISMHPDQFTLLNAANLYFADQAPWGLKADLPRMGTILSTTADVVRRAAIAAQPFVPDSAAKFLDALAIPADQRQLSHALSPGGMPGGTALPPPEPVFKKFEHPKTA